MCWWQVFSGWYVLARYRQFAYNTKMTCPAQVVRIYRFSGLPKTMLARISEGRKEASRLWNFCVDLHREVRKASGKWPWKKEIHQATKGKFLLHSQTVQMVAYAFLANVDTARQLRAEGNVKIRYPYKEKKYYPLLWPGQAVAVQGNHIVLPMGRGRKSIVLPKPEGFVPGGAKLVWSGDVNELHVTVEAEEHFATRAKDERKVVATVDLGQIHQAAAVASSGSAIVVSGRGQRSLKRRKNRMHGQVARLQSRCAKGSRRRKKLSKARFRCAARIDRQVKDLAHKGTRSVVDHLAEAGVVEVFIGNPNGVVKKKNGRKHNQRMAQWEYGRDIRYLQEKLSRVGISSFTGSERGTSSRCPVCGHKHKPKGRVWACKACGFTGHRDLVGAVNMHQDNFVQLDRFPEHVTYLRPSGGKFRKAAGTKSRRPGSSSRPDSGRGKEETLPSVPALPYEPAPNTNCSNIGREVGHRCGV